MDKEDITGRVDNSWRTLNQYTAARIGLGRTGVSQTTQQHLAFQLAHACAQDAVNRPMHWDSLIQLCSQFDVPHLHLYSQAESRATYLQRPDLGRKLSPESEDRLQAYIADSADISYPVRCALVVVDGLSSTGIENHTPALLGAIMKEAEHHAIKPDVICTVEQGRVAIGDGIAQLLKAELTVVIIGERPGLSSPDSVGIYFTYQARLGVSDAERNCISNIRPAGLPFHEAAARLFWLMESALARKISGVKLKDESLDNRDDGLAGSYDNFLLPK